MLSKRSNSKQKNIGISLTERITIKIGIRFNDSQFKERARINPADFTRNRKMPFNMVMIFMLISLKCSTSSALRRFFKMFEKPEVVKQQSYSEARMKIRYEAVEEIYRLTVQPMTEERRKKWNGFRIYAIDGSKIALPTDKKLVEYFGALGKDKTAATAQCSILYDVLNDIVADALIYPLNYDERTLASWHINRCMDIEPDSKKLLIFDRGYASFKLIEQIENDGYFFVMRVKAKFNLDIDAQTSSDGHVQIEQDGRRIKVRVIKFALDSGEIETLVTNIFDKRMGKKAFKKLYFTRWPIEIKYDIVKNKLNLEMFSSRTVGGIMQDFFATMCLVNIASSAVYDAQSSIERARLGKNNKYDYRANINEAIGVLKDEFISVFVIDDPILRSNSMNSIIASIASYVVPVRPNRSEPRKPPRSTRFNHNQRTNC